MSAEVIQFNPREEPSITGEAICIGCRNEWGAVAPVGTWQLECPSCGAHKGIFKHPVGGSLAGDSFFACSCGCEALSAYLREGKFYLRCMQCGEDQTEAIFGE